MISTSYANAANDLSTSFAALLPIDAGDVADFLFEAAYAYGEREADLARKIGVSRATMSGWKKRGAVPPAHLRWFQENFVVEILQGANPPQHEGFRHVGLRLALALYQATDFNPFDLPGKTAEDRLSICYRHLGGISRLGLFVLRREEALAHREGLNVNDRWWTHVLPRLRELTTLAGQPIFS